MITIDNITIRQDNEGRYCLNDLHKAAGGAEKHNPNRWTRLDTFRDLVTEVQNQTPDVALAPTRSASWRSKVPRGSSRLTCVPLSGMRFAQMGRSM